MGKQTVADAWKSLRSSVKAAAAGVTFSNSQLTASSPVPSYIGTRSVGGDIVYFSDTPETVNASTLLANGNTAASVGYNCILFTDTQEMSVNLRHRLMFHHANSIGANQVLSVKAINLGMTEARLKFGPTFGGEPLETTAAGLDASNQFLNATDALQAQVPNDDIASLDAHPDVTATETIIPMFDGTSATIINLKSVTFQNLKTNSCQCEMMALDPGVHIYVVLNEPPASCYQDDTQTCARNLHARGTFDDRVCSRIEQNYVINSGLETPGVFRMVTTAAEELPNDTNWAGQDRTLWSGAVADNNVAYSRLFYSRVTVSNTSGSTKSFAIVATPRTPSSACFTYIRDVGGNVTRRVPTTGSVATGDTTKGTVIWKGTVAGGATLSKRMRYFPTASSSTKLSLWVIPYV
jgi:hypothetical protein